MKRADLLALQAHQGYPMLSILLPTHRTSPENQADPILCRNLLREATERLQDELGKREVAQILTEVEELVEELDWAHTLDGLAIFASEGHAQVVHLPYAVKPRVVVDHSYATRDVVFAFNRSPRYRVLVLSEKHTRLYDAVLSDLTEHVGGGFPKVFQGPGGGGRIAEGTGINASRLRDDLHRQFFREVDAALAAIDREDELPLVVVGVDRHLALFAEVAGSAERLLGTVKGSYDKRGAHELGRLAWEVAQQGLAARREAVLGELAQAVGHDKAVSGLERVWRAAAEGRGRVLLVDPTFTAAGILDESGARLTWVEDPTAPGVIDDVVDELIELVIAKGGSVVFQEQGLDEHDGVALILRW
jgi:hypothetical protein